ncbi:MAG: hypothetical protein ACREDA_05230 [Methylocella sp.]
MGLFGKLFSKKTDPELERLLQKLADASAECKTPKGPLGLPATAAKGAEARRWLFELIDEFGAATGEIGGLEADDGTFFYHEQLIEWYQKRQDLPESKLFLESLISVFPTPNGKRRLDENWPAIVAGYQGKPNTDDTLIDKADRLANYIILRLGIATDLYRLIIEDSPDKLKDYHEINDELTELVKLEESALWFRTINDIANSCIPRECPSFMGYFADALGYYLAVQGASPDALCRTMADRLKEYNCYREWVAGADEPQAGTLLWEAGKHLMEALGFGRSAWFQVRFANWFLESVKEALFYELLTGESASNK